MENMIKYHAHVYFELEQIEDIQYLYEQLKQQVPVSTSVGRLWLKTVGPHTQPMFQLEFDEAYLQQIQALLTKLCCEYSVLIHPVISDEYLAHTQYARWLGTPLPLNLEKL